MSDSAEKVAADTVRVQYDALEKLGWAADDGIPVHIRESAAKMWAGVLKQFAAPSPLPSEEVVRELAAEIINKTWDEVLGRLRAASLSGGRTGLEIHTVPELWVNVRVTVFEYVVEALTAARAAGYGESSALSPREGG